MQNPKSKKTNPILANNDISNIKHLIKKSNEIRGKIIVLKLTSTIIENEELLSNFIENVYLITLCGAKIFIVHDHTNMVKHTLALFGLNEKLIQNISVSDHKSSKIVEMVVSGYINQLIVSKLCSFGCNAIGISGKDTNMIQAKKSKFLHKKTNNSEIIDVGFVSEPVLINPEILLHFEDSDIIPVISPIASDENGATHLLDVNLVTSLISIALDADYLIFPCTEHILINYKSSNNSNDYEPLRKILAKNNTANYQSKSLLEAAGSAIENSSNSVYFVDAAAPDAVLMSLFNLGNFTELNSY